MPHTEGPWDALALECKGDILSGYAIEFANPDDRPLVLQAPAMLSLLEELECNHLDCDGRTNPNCPVCGAMIEDADDPTEPHKPDCRLAAVLKAAKGEA